MGIISSAAVRALLFAFSDAWLSALLSLTLCMKLALIQLEFVARFVAE